MIDPMSAAPKVAVVGSPSSNSEVTLDLLGDAAHEPLVGSMLFLEVPLRGGQELALGTVTEVTTENPWHTNPMLRGVVKTRGHIPGMSGDHGDVRDASIKIQAVYKCHEQDGAYTPWVQSGPTLRMSPATGTPVRRVTDEVIDALMRAETDLHYLGYLHGTTVRVPMSVRDFSSERGAFHIAFFGMSGAGKSAFSAYFFAGQMRHRDLGMIIIDPQGQWSSETGLPFSLQEFARELGREVVVRRISEDLRLPKDAPLFVELLAKTRFAAEIAKMSAETTGYLFDEIVKILRKRPDWDSEDSPTLLRAVLAGLCDASVLGRIYADTSKQDRLREAIEEILADSDRFGDVLRQFYPLHNLFGPTNPAGGQRHSLWATISHVFDKQARAGQPAPLLILDMSTSGQISWLASLLDSSDDQSQAREALQILDQDSIKASILRKACRTLKEASEAAFRDGDTLNTMVIFDEAWRFAPPPHTTSDEEIKALSSDLAGYARDTRKFGIGWAYITQSPRGLNPEIWDQLLVRVIGYGLGGADLDKLAEQMDDPDHLKLYKGFAPPDSTKPKIYPFMITGPVSPLSFTRAPVFLAAYTDFDDFRRDNHHWISQIRASMGQPVLSGIPRRKHTGPVRRSTTTSTATRPARTTMDLIRQADRVKAHAATGGVDPAAGKGLLTDSGFAAAGIGNIDDDDIPPF